ncbi:MAG: ABC transporter ATP-binding protein [Methanobacteriota archaeon]|nr:MAG: ABC transporter ATP-binding protein [Euryarchaeota archaeon]
MADSALQATDIVGGYGKAVVVQGVSVRLGRKELVALVGPNGSGKSTLLKSIYGLASLFSGTVSWDGRDITRVGPEEKARLGIGYVPQVDNVFPDLRVRENLEMGSYFRRDKAAVLADMEGVFGIFPVLRERREQMASTLSGGERQMLAIGRALMARPSVLFLDEPTAALAPKIVAELFRRVRAIRDSGVSILLVEQHARKALEIADRGYVLVAGKIAMEGGGAEILANEDLKRVFLGAK